MKDLNEYEKDLASIRSMMERSAKFLSLSGLSGVLSGAYALVGSAAAYQVMDDHTRAEVPLTPLLVLAAVVFILSIGTGCLFSWRKAGKIGAPIWNATSKQLLIDLIIPLGTGGILIFIFLSRGYYSLAAPASLIFYGMALIQGGRNTYDEIRYLGLTEIVLGLTCAWFPDYGLAFWAVGFGVMHIVYGTVMHFRYDR